MSQDTKAEFPVPSEFARQQGINEALGDREGKQGILPGTNGGNHNESYGI